MTHKQEGQEEDHWSAKSDFLFLEDDDDEETTIYYCIGRYGHLINSEPGFSYLLYQDRRYHPIEYRK